MESRDLPSDLSELLHEKYGQFWYWDCYNPPDVIGPFFTYDEAEESMYNYYA